MSTTIANFDSKAVTEERSSPSYQAHQILHSFAGTDARKADAIALVEYHRVQESSR